MSTRIIRFILLIVFLVAVGGAFRIGQIRTHLDADITSALPQHDPVVRAAQDILNHHPALGNIYIDLGQKNGESGRNDLADAAVYVSKELSDSGLVNVVDEARLAEIMPQVLNLITGNLPLFFTSEDLESQVAPLIRPDRIETALKQARRDLFELGGIGQAKYLATDPLGLRNPVLARFAKAMPFGDATIYRGHIFTRDWNHVIIIAEPKASTHDTIFASKLGNLLTNLSVELKGNDSGKAPSIQLHYTGAFRAALDNESIIKHDTQRALLLVTIGLAIIVLGCFRRPWIGLLAIVPALCGAALALFAYSLFKSTIFAVALGFAGALISITVDHGLAYVLYLDRPSPANGRDISRQVWSVTSFTVYTTVAALLSLTFSNIPLFEQVGFFAALGVGLAAISVHVMFPLLFPHLKAAKRSPFFPMDRLMTFLTSAKGWKPPVLALIIAIFFSFFIRLDFSGDLKTMNTMKPETIAAENEINRIWGNVSQGTYIMARAANLDSLWMEAEKLDGFLKTEEDRGQIDEAGLRLTIFPGPNERLKKLQAWKDFWTEERKQSVRDNLTTTGAQLGFSANAFEPFFQSLETSSLDTKLPESILPALGVFPDKRGGWLLLEILSPTAAYSAESFFHRAWNEEFAVFDADYFSVHIAEALNRSFLKMLVIIGLAAILLLFFLFVDWALLLTALSPLVFSLVGTLGTLGLLGRPLSIPSLMLAPVIVGLGMDYGLYLVRSKQRFREENTPTISAFRAAVLLGGLSTLIGTGSLALSEHRVLQDAGLSTFLGIFYALVGAFLIIPPLLDRLFQENATDARIVASDPRQQRALALERYKRLEPTPRLSARFKMQLDPMFPRLDDFVQNGWTILDIGCGYGIPSAWLLSHFPDLNFISLEPDAERVRVARLALGNRADVHQALAQDVLHMDLPELDAVLFLDVVHYLDDHELASLLVHLHRLLKPSGRLIMRATVPGGQSQVWQRQLETLRIRFKGLRSYYRSEDALSLALRQADFNLLIVEPTAEGREETWFVAERSSFVTN